MWLGLYGRFSLHPTDDRVLADDEFPADAYQLFYARSSAMGWLTDAIRPEPCRLWGTNEAELEEASDADPPLIAWFQVVVTEPTGIHGLPPIQPLLACAEAVVHRMGAFELDAARIVLPPPDPTADNPPGSDGIGHLGDAAGWFAHCDRRRGTSVQFAIDGGQVPTIATVASDIFRWTHKFLPDARVFRCDRFDTFDDSSMTVPGFGDEQWAGPARYRATFSGDLIEWSLDAVGWTAAFLAHACHRNGVDTPVVITAARAASS